MSTNQYNIPPRPRWPYLVGPLFVTALLFGLPYISLAVSGIESLVPRVFVGCVASLGWSTFCVVGVVLCIYYLDPTDSKHYDT